MAFTHNFGEYNITSSINYFIRSNLGTNVPSWMTWSYGATPPRTLNFDFPDQPLTFPSFAVTHQGSEPIENYEGDRADGSNKGTRRMGQVEINCWVSEIIENADGSKSRDNQWVLKLKTMRDMIFKLFQQNRDIALYQFDTPTAPVALNSVLQVRTIREMPLLAMERTPGIHRSRIIVTYYWTERY